MAKLPILITLVCGIAGSANAYQLFSTQSEITQNSLLQIAQSTDTVLSDSDLRRINHYADRSLTSLLALEDEPSEQGLLAIRTDIKRYLDATARSGLSEQQASEYFKAYASGSVSDIHEQFLDASGQFDVAGLFQSVNAVFLLGNSAEVDIAAVDEEDLAAMRSMANSKTTPVVNQPPAETEAQPIVEAKAEPVVEAEAQPAIEVEAQPVIEAEAQPEIASKTQGPEIPDGANPIDRAILERVYVRDGKWVVNVIRGDSLGQFSNALYGDRREYLRIYEANRNVLTSPNVITVGTILVLPQEN